jgi:hypothetical protein
MQVISAAKNLECSCICTSNEDGVHGRSKSTEEQTNECSADSLPAAWDFLHMTNTRCMITAQQTHEKDPDRRMLVEVKVPCGRRGKFFLAKQVWRLEALSE